MSHWDFTRFKRSYGDYPLCIQFDIAAFSEELGTPQGGKKKKKEFREERAHGPSVCLPIQLM